MQDIIYTVQYPDPKLGYDNLIQATNVWRYLEEVEGWSLNKEVVDLNVENDILTGEELFASLVLDGPNSVKHPLVQEKSLRHGWPGLKSAHGRGMRDDLSRLGRWAVNERRRQNPVTRKQDAEGNRGRASEWRNTPDGYFYFWFKKHAGQRGGYATPLTESDLIMTRALVEELRLLNEKEGKGSWSLNHKISIALGGDALHSHNLELMPYEENRLLGSQLEHRIRNNQATDAEVDEYFSRGVSADEAFANFINNDDAESTDPTYLKRYNWSHDGIKPEWDPNRREL